MLSTDYILKMKFRVRMIAKLTVQKWNKKGSVCLICVYEMSFFDNFYSNVYAVLCLNLTGVVRYRKLVHIIAF
jgi:hypothetical protein